MPAPGSRIELGNQGIICQLLVRKLNRQPGKNEPRPSLQITTICLKTNQIKELGKSEPVPTYLILRNLLQIL